MTKFGVLLCGKKELMEGARKLLMKTPDIHLQYTSSPKFVMSRAMFNAPNLLLIDTQCERQMLGDVLRMLNAQLKSVPVYMISSSPNYHDAVHFVKLGARGYFVLPRDAVALDGELKLALEDWRNAINQQQFARLQRTAYNFDQILGNSGSLQETLKRAKKVIDNTTMTVLITGETGTGKELLARALHYNSKNSERPFVDIACSALPETLLESELFGFEKGAFTDARERKLGLFELAEDGTIFLDEIGDISPMIQSKLLKVIEGRTMRRLGGLKDIPIRARIIAATSADLELKMKSGHFRRDLYHRLKILPLDVPPLRERKEDIPLLACSFVDLFNKIYGKNIEGLTPEAMNLLLECVWPGNIREFKHSLERAVLIKEGGMLDERDFHFLLEAHPSGSDPTRGQNGEKNNGKPQDSFSLEISLDEASVEDVQRRLALLVLERVGGNKSKAAYILRVSRPRLDRILKSGLD